MNVANKIKMYMLSSPQMQQTNFFEQLNDKKKIWNKKIELAWIALWVKLVDI